VETEQSGNTLPVIKMAVRIYRPLTEVWEKLTDPVHMVQWLGNEISTDMREGGTMKFGGPNAPLTPEISGEWRINTIKEQRGVLFTWNILGAETLVLVRLKEIPIGTLLEVRHGAIPPAAEVFHLPEHWTLMLANFRSLVELGEPALRFDYSKYHPLRVTRYDPTEVRLSVFIRAPPSLPFDVWTNPEKLRHFIGVEKPVVDRRYGGIYTWWAEGKGPVVFTKLEQDREIEFTWVYGDEPETRVNIRFEPVEGNTLVVLHHYGFRRPEDVLGYDIGWASILGELKLTCELGESGIERSSTWEEVRF